MKRYKLLKDLPFAKAGDIFKGELEYGTTVLFPEYYENYEHKLNSDESRDFDEWFKEIKEYYVINSVFGDISKKNDNIYSDLQIKTMRDLGMLFDTWLEADRKLAYFKAKAIIKQDTKGFKPNWQDTDEEKYYGEWDFDDKTPHIGLLTNFKKPQIYFKSKQDIIDSFAKHPEEWKTYLTYEQ